MRQIRRLALPMLLALLSVVPARAQALSLQRDDHVCLLGNTLAERMQHDGFLEAMLQICHPDAHLVIRNLGFSGDELTLRLRSQDFGTPDQHLALNRADVILAMFGYNESFAGEAGLANFKQQLSQFIEHARSQQYNGSTAPRLVLFSPIAHEDLRDPSLPDGVENNRRLASYTAATGEVAAEHNVAFVDLFHPTQQAYATSSQPWTINGIHLNAWGNQQVAEIVRRSLFPAAPEIDWQSARAQAVRQAIQDKNFYWFNRYRTTDGFSIFGGRADLRFVDGQTNRVVMQREMEVLDYLTANRDAKVWATVAGEAFEVDDSQAPAFIPVVTNKPGEGPGGSHLYLGGEQAIEKMTVAEGMRVELFASEEQFPELINPVQMAFDPQGRLWVSAWESYPHWKPTEVMNDKLLILEDTDGDGRADVCKTFAGGLHNPTGFEFYGGGVIVAMAPDLIFLRDVDGDDRADVRQRILHGLDSADTHHTANSFVLDPGGALYFQEGTFHHTQVETPYGPSVRSANAAVYRYEPRAHKFDVYVAYGFANPHGHVFDRWGQDFVHDGTGAVPYHGALFSGHLDFPAKHGGPPTLYQQRTRPCPATELVSGSHFPPESQGNLLVGNVIGFQGILQYRLKDRGASLEGEEIEPILFSSDPNFRPVDLEIAPDGSLYFTDWQNPVIGHMQHNLRDPSRDRRHGRVYRVTCVDRPLMDAPAIAGQPIASLVALLGHPADRVRYRAKIELSGRESAAVLAAAQQWMDQLDTKDPDYEHHLLEGLWLHQYHNVVDRDLLERLLRSEDFRARAAAVRVLCYWRDRLPDALERLKSLAADEHPRVRLEAIRAASFFPVAEAIEVALISTEYPSDEYLDYTRNETMRALEPYWKRAIEAGQPIAVTSDVGMHWLLERVRVDELTRMPRSAAVSRELLSRDGVQDAFRQEALVALAADSHQSPVQVLLDAVETIDRQAAPGAVLFDLGRLLANWNPADIAAELDRLQRLAIEGNTPTARQIGFASWMMASASTEHAWQLGLTSVQALKDLVGSLPMLPDPLLQDQLFEHVAGLLDELPESVAQQLGGRPTDRGTYGRYVRIELPGRRRTLTLAEVQVLSDGRNVARQGRASQSATAHGGVASKAIDGNLSGTYGAGGQTHTPEDSRDPWWELDLGEELPLEAIEIHNRTDGDLGRRLDGFTLKILDAAHHPVFVQEGQPAPPREVTIALEAGGPQGTIRRSVMLALPYVRGHETETFGRLSQFIAADVDRVTAVRAIMRIPSRDWPADHITPLLEQMLTYVRGLSEAERSQPAGADALQLADALASRLPTDQARPLHRELRGLGVRKLRLGTVPHRMVYDQDRLVVEAGKRVEIVFENGDIMPHNFVITQPGALEETGLLAEVTAQQPGALQRHFVPESDKIIVSSELLQPRDAQTISFTAPEKPGIYPYVCTYPGHWRRMYGSLFVVPDLDAFEADGEAYLAAQGIEAHDELLKSVRPVQLWRVADLAPALADLDQGRSFATGRRMFQLATCIACHRLNNEGHEIAPDLTKLDIKLQPVDVLRHMIEPSAEINKDYQTYVVELASGQIVTGLLISQDQQTIQLLENPLVTTTPRVIGISEIEHQSKSTKSMMPEGLLDRLTREEILDLLAYVYARGNEHHELFHGAHHH